MIPLHSRKQQRRQSCDSTKEAGDDSFPEAAEETGITMSTNTMITNTMVNDTMVNNTKTDNTKTDDAKTENTKTSLRRKEPPHGR